jgi:nitrite reductase (NADH) large subunit
VSGKQPSKVKSFRQFVNSDTVDGNIEFVTERDQIRPAQGDEKKYGVQIQAVDLTPS